jgi:hypothetical protein
MHRSSLGRPLAFACGTMLALLSGSCAPIAPDLVVSAVDVPASPIAAAYPWELGATVVNMGTRSAAASSLWYWYSSDAVLDAGDVLIGTSAVPSLAPGDAYADVWSTTYSVADSGGSAGTHRIFAVADADSGITESDEANNTTGAAVKVLYERVIIDTYQPKDSVIVANTFASLFDPAGDTTTDIDPDLWNNNHHPHTVDAPPISIAEDDDSNPTYFGCARIDYKDGLAPGTYYVRVRGRKSTNTGVYAVRVLLAPDENYPAWFFGSTNMPDTPYETDDYPQSGGVPMHPVPIAVDGKLNRALTTDGDVDWLVFTLP